MNGIINNIDVKNMIYMVRGKYVILDRDIALLYKSETRVVNQKVKRNISRFPEEFYFQMTDEEFINWKSQIVISDNDKVGLRRPPYVFTEQGVAMLSAIINTQTAINISIQIMSAFVEMKKYISTNLIEQKYINNQVLKNTEDIKTLQNFFAKFEEKKVTNEIYFEGQIYDAYSKIVDILKEAKEELIIIDGYADKTVLDMIKEVSVKTTLVVKNKTLLKKLDIEKYNQQYNNLQILKNDSFHDRYIILDRNVVYHCGASLNFAGSKTFSINKLEDEMIIELLLNKINIINSKNTCI